MLDIDDLMSGLFLRRRIFHSEADFQHALAWHIHETRPDCNVRLEYNASPPDQPRVALDIWIELSGVEAVIELKYCTRLLQQRWQGEYFALRNQSAQDTRRYDFLKDIQRVEQLMANRPSVKGGFAVVLTNDSSYWTRSSRNNQADAAFRIHEGKRVSNQELVWGESASAGTKRNREDAIQLTGSYIMRWRDYSSFGDKPGEIFRYLAVAVTPNMESAT